LPNIYAFLRACGHAQEPPWLAQQLASVTDPTPIIVETGLQSTEPNEICAKTLMMFVSILGSEAGNLALKVLATGGMYLGGGIPPRILTALDGSLFMEAFSRKGRFADLLSRIPVHAIKNPKTALLGAAAAGFDAASQSLSSERA
jgi:glucokinase